MVSYEKIISNFTKILDETESSLFAHPTEEQLEKLRQLVGNKVPKFIDFYEKYEPQHGFPTLFWLQAILFALIIMIWGVWNSTMCRMLSVTHTKRQITSRLII